MDPEKVGFIIKVLRIEKLEPPKNIAIKVDFKGNNIDRSEIITSERSEAEVNWEVFYEVPNITENVVDDLIAHPFVFSALQEVSSTSPFKRAATSKKQSVVKDKSPSRKSSKTTKVSSGSISIKSKSSKSFKGSIPSNDMADLKNIESFELFGLATLDLMPLLRGNNEMGEVLLLHPLVDLTGSQAIAWTNLSRMEVTVTSCGNCSEMLSERVTNIIFFTVESLQNVTPIFLNDDVQSATIFPRNQDFEVVKFTHSSVETDKVQPYKKKKWFGLSDMSGPAAFSPYKISEDSLENTMEYKITNESLDKEPRVQWNQLRRSVFTHESQEIFKKKLTTHRCWPIEIVIFNSSEKKTDKKDNKGRPTSGSKKSLNGVVADSKHFIAFLDLSNLIYPGVTNCRVTSQIYFYKDGLMGSRFGSDHKMFESPRATSSIKINDPAKSVSSNKQSSKKTASKSPKNEKLTSIEEEVKEVPTLPTEPEPVLNDQEEPVFIIVQVEFLNPLIEKRPTEEVLKSVQSIIPQRVQPTVEQQAIITSTESFEESIKQLMHVIHNEYQIFNSGNGKASLFKITTEFLMHLHMTGTYSKIQESIRDPLKAYVEGAIGLPEGLDKTRPDHQEVLSQIYLTVVRKMCDTVNASSQVAEYNPDIPYDDLLYFAVEAWEQDYHEKTQQYLLQRLERSKKSDPQAWVDYATLWLKKQEFEKAGECVREAISIDPKYTPALFFQGLLSWLTEDFEVAELFLLAVSSLDPHLSEGWVVLYMFHKQMDKQLAAKTEIEFGRKSMRGKLFCKDRADPILSWNPSIADPQRVFLVTATFLLHFSFPELAEVALSYDLLEHGRSVDYLYYLAVCHYIQGRYIDSLDHIEEALKTVWEDGRLWALKGHDYYKLENYSEAKQAFDFALNLISSPDDTRLINLRLGNICCAGDELEKAEQFYFKVCHDHGSPLSWQALGITAFLNENLEDAELALNEANLLDSRLPQVWGYLALVNLMFARPGVYKQCMSQAILFGYDDPALLERINILAEFVQPTHI